MSRGRRTEPPPPTKYSAHALRQRVKGAPFGNPDMRRCGNFQASTDDSAVQCRDDRHGAILDPVEGLVRHARQAHRGRPVRLRKHGQIGAGAKMAAFAMQDDRPRPLGRRVEDRLDAGDHLGIDGIALGRSREPHESHGAMLADDHAVRRVARCRLAPFPSLRVGPGCRTACGSVRKVLAPIGLTMNPCLHCSRLSVCGLRHAAAATQIGSSDVRTAVCRRI